MPTKIIRNITEYHVVGYAPGCIPIKYDYDGYSKIEQRRKLRVQGKLKGEIYGLKQAIDHAKEIAAGAAPGFVCSVVKEISKRTTVWKLN